VYIPGFYSFYFIVTRKVRFKFKQSIFSKRQTYPRSTEYCSNIINIAATLQYCRNIAAMLCAVWISFSSKGTYD